VVHGSGNSGDDVIEEGLRARVMFQKEFHLAALLRISAVLNEEGRALVGGKRYCRLKQSFYCRLHFDTSLRSQALATRSCRCTVWTGTFTHAEISSAVKPPKKRISTILDLSSSSNARRCSASLTASTVGEHSEANSKTSGTTSFSPPPRFAACRER